MRLAKLVRQHTTNTITNLLLSAGMNHVHAGHFTYGEITGASVAKKLDRIFRFAGASERRIGVEKICDVGMGYELEEKTACKCEPRDSGFRG